MERNKTIMKLCYLQTTFYIVFLTALITRHRRGISQKTFAFLIILSLVGCAVSLTLGDYLRNMIRSSGFDVAGVHDIGKEAATASECRRYIKCGCHDVRSEQSEKDQRYIWSRTGGCVYSDLCFLPDTDTH